VPIKPGRPGWFWRWHLTPGSKHYRMVFVTDTGSVKALGWALFAGGVGTIVAGAARQVRGRGAVSVSSSWRTGWGRNALVYWVGLAIAIAGSVILKANGS